MEIEKREVYEVDGYQFNTLELARLYQLLYDHLSDNDHWYFVKYDDQLVVKSFDNIVNIELVSINEDSFVLTYQAFDSDPTITTDMILDYHRKGIRFEFNSHIKRLVIQSNLENIVKNLNILFEETRHF